jgi:hypothetical protein
LDPVVQGQPQVPIGAELLVDVASFPALVDDRKKGANVDNTEQHIENKSRISIYPADTIDVPDPDFAPIARDRQLSTRAIFQN